MGEHCSKYFKQGKTPGQVEDILNVVGIVMRHITSTGHRERQLLQSSGGLFETVLTLSDSF